MSMCVGSGRYGVFTSTECYSIGSRGHPISHGCSAHFVSEGDHTSDGLPTVLAEPAVGPFVTRASSKACPGQGQPVISHDAQTVTLPFFGAPESGSLKL